MTLRAEAMNPLISITSRAGINKSILYIIAGDREATRPVSNRNGT